MGISELFEKTPMSALNSFSQRDSHAFFTCDTLNGGEFLTKYWIKVFVKIRVSKLHQRSKENVSKQPSPVSTRNLTDNV
jgi:hypothetical protein